MSKEITLTQGKVAIVDDEDFEWLNQWKWCIVQNKYAHRNAGNGRWQRMHRLIMGNPEGKVVDHVNGDTLDNRKENLRVCSQQENTMNSKISKNSRSGIKDVWWDKSREKWFVQVMYKGKKHSVGRFLDIEEAIVARDNEINKLHGNFARTEKHYV